MSAVGRAAPPAGPAIFDGLRALHDAFEVRRRRGWVVRRALLTADAAGLFTAYLLTAWLAAGGIGRLGFVYFVATLPFWVVGAKLYGLYEGDEERTDRSTLDDIGGVVHLVTMGVWLLFLATWVTGISRTGLQAFIVLWALGIVLVMFARAVSRTVCRHTSAYLETAAIVGAGEIGDLLARKLRQHPEFRIDVAAVVDNAAELPELVERLGITRVIVANSDDTGDDTLTVLRRLGDHGVHVDLAPRMFELVGPRVCLHTLEGFPLLGVPPARLSPSSGLIKRTLDVAVAAAVLLVTAPLFAYIAWRVRRDSPGPVLFRQTRLGLNMKEFTVLKFRTMRVDVDDSAHRDFIAHSMTTSQQTAGNGLFKLERRNDITHFGAWLRKTSLDELPQLINVLKGDMSLVGPRPCIPYETEHFAPHHFDRFLVPAGITGLWQVTARANTTFGEALDMDVAYARGWSLSLDLKLLLRTPFQVISQKATA